MPNRWLIGGATFLAVLLIASIVVVLLEQEQPLDPGTPEAAVQNFLKAAESEDIQVAYEYLSFSLRENCKLETFGGRNFPKDRLENDRIVLEETTMADDTAFVSIRVTQFRGTGPFGTSEYTSTQRFSLKQEDGKWKFAEYPWPYYNCGPVRFPPPPIPAPTAVPPPTPVATATP